MMTNWEKLQILCFPLMVLIAVLAVEVFLGAR